MERLIYNIGKARHKDPTFWDNIPTDRWLWIVAATRSAGITQDFNALMDLYDCEKAK